jgi:hypothetical protein
MRLASSLLWLTACSAAPIPEAESTPTPAPNRPAATTLAAKPNASVTASPSASPATIPSGPLAATPSASLALTANARVPAPSEAELPKGTTVLHVGDSMADALGKDLKRELEAVGLKNPLKYEEATYIPQWAGKLDSMGYRALLAQHNPDLVIITLGGNELAMPNPQERAAPIREMVRALGDRPCIWIAAPLWPSATHTGLFEVIKANCAPCVFVDTNAMLKLEVLASDKVHPTLAERKRWARFMIRWLRHNREPNGPKPWSIKQATEPPTPP